MRAQAARARATLGEICDALERAWGRHESATSVSAGAYTADVGSGRMQEEVGA